MLKSLERTILDLKRENRYVSYLANWLIRQLSRENIYYYFIKAYRRLIQNNFPLYVSIEITNVCNLRCRHCQYHYGVKHYTRDKQFIDIELFKKIIDEIDQYGADVQTGADGEAFMHKDFMTMLEYACSKKNIGKINFNTNGNLLTKEIIDHMVKFFRGYIFFSVEGDREFHNHLRIGSDYDRVVNNINYLTEKIRVENINRIKVGVSLCNVEHTHQSREEFWKEWIDKVDFVVMGEVNDKNGKCISKNPMTNLTNGKQRRIPCQIPWSTCEICADGTMTPCSVFITRANTHHYGSMGNVNDMSIFQLWNSDHFNELRQRHLKNTYKSTLCDTCDRWKSQYQLPDELIDNSYIVKRNGVWTSFSHLREKVV